MPPSGLKKQRISNLIEGKGKLLPSSKAPPERNSTLNTRKNHRNTTAERKQQLPSSQALTLSWRNSIQGNRERQLNEPRNKINDQKECFPKYWNFKIKLNRNSRAERQTRSQMKNALEITGNRTELMSLKMEN